MTARFDELHLRASDVELPTADREEALDLLRELVARQRSTEAGQVDGIDYARLSDLELMEIIAGATLEELEEAERYCAELAVAEAARAAASLAAEQAARDADDARTLAARDILREQGEQVGTGGPAPVTP